MPRRSAETFPCPHCGDDVPVSAKACPHCGADEETGWADDADYAALDLPGGYNDDDGADTAISGSRMPRWAIVTLIIVCVAIIGLALLGR